MRTIYVARKQKCETKIKKKLNFMAPFYGWGSTASRLEPLRGGLTGFSADSAEKGRC